MVFKNTAPGILGRALREPSLMLLMAFLVCMLSNVAKAAALPATGMPLQYTAVKAGNVASITTSVFRAHQYVVNGSFNGSELYYSATLENSAPLPDWIGLEGVTGVFNIEAPAAAIGHQYKVIVTATDERLATATSSFYINVVYDGPGCLAEANTDMLGKILDCTSGTVRLRGFTTSGKYQWSGPKGFSSDEKEPLVSEPGLYVLTGEGKEICARRSVVEVRPSRPDCAQRSLHNKLPAGEVISSSTQGVTELTVQFDAFDSDDVDGTVEGYRWTWEGGSASGARPRITFAEGSYPVILTVMDNTGAKSTTEHTVVVDRKVEQHNFWLEAECAQVGGNWSLVQDGSAAGGSYVAATRRSMSTAPADAPENYVRFTLENVKEGGYDLHARISAADNRHDSYWIRVNEGAWREWKSGIRKGGSFKWNRNRSPIQLEDGENTIDFSFRETDTRLDKLFVTDSNTVPSGSGRRASNCEDQQAPVASATASILTGTGPLALTLNASDSYDRDGNITSYTWTWAGGMATGALPRPTFGIGTHEVILTVVDNDGLRATDTLTVSVNAPVVIVEETETEIEEEPDTEEKTASEEVIAASGTELWLEAECAVVGSKWQTVSDTEAGGGQYVVVEKGNALGGVPTDTEENRVRFTLSADSAGTYRLFARISAPSNLDDSYYVRINGTEWFKWNSGIRQGTGFEWNRYPNTVSLTQGVNTIDFAYREDDTRLDKLYLSLGESTPTGVGIDGQNCAAPPVPDYANEAECAKTGDGWESIVSAQASGNSYLVFTGKRSTTAAAGDDPAQLVNFSVNAQEAGDHQLYFRINAPDPGRNSLWVRVDGSNWMKFWEEIGGRQLLTEGFEWKKVSDDGEAITLNLTAGPHTVTVANREPGTMLDKVFLSPIDETPVGMGPDANNCRVVSAPTYMGSMMGATVSDDSEPAEMSGASVFPNPVGNSLSLNLVSSYRGNVSVVVSDLNGKRVIVREITKLTERLSDRFQTENLPAGMYYMRIWEAERQTVKPFVKR